MVKSYWSKCFNHLFLRKRYLFNQLLFPSGKSRESYRSDLKKMIQVAGIYKPKISFTISDNVLLLFFMRSLICYSRVKRLALLFRLMILFCFLPSFPNPIDERQELFWYRSASAKLLTGHVPGDALLHIRMRGH
jgi:hypothetical protein